MSQLFQVFQLASGDLNCADGMVIDRGTGAAFTVGDGSAKPGIAGSTAPSLNDAQEIPRIQGVTFLGGSGRNVIVTGLAALDGVYRPARPGTWKHDVFTLTVVSGSSATISDDEDVVAELTTGGDAPGGSYVATTYGEDTYNEGDAFTLTGAKETGWPGTPNDLEVEVSEGTALGGSYTSTDGVNYVSAMDALWTLTLNADGTAEMAYNGTVVALRTSGPNDDPCGMYEATDEGFFLNPEFPALTEGDPVETNPFGTLTLEFTWPSTPDLDIGVTFLDKTAGYGHDEATGSSPFNVGDYMTWTGDDTSAAGSETVAIDLAQAWEDGAISTFADVMAAADWFPPRNGSGPAELVVTYDPPGSSGTPVTHVIRPGKLTPSVTAVLALRVLADGTVSKLGAEWTARVSAVRKTPRAGVVYVSITEGTAEVDAVAGPFFATTLPTPSAGTVHFQLAESDGAGAVKQGHTGPLIWDIRPAGRLRWGTVASSTESGTQGEVQMDGSYIYGCVATDTWGRMELDLTAWP